MVQVIDNDADIKTISPVYSTSSIVYIGILLAVFYFLIQAIIASYVHSMDSSSGIAAIMTATLGIVIMTSKHMTQPLMINAAAGISLYGLAKWTNGLGVLESIIWTVLLYVLAYLVFSWISRYTKVIWSVLLVLIMVVIVRVISEL